ncbi:zinc-dependent alcohol dehydrogenase family protein [Dongia rigui]|uniref:Zinc-dependent alcohol dehydrogenase family protein n=1 Tax=Dongia rigui TaxID=940149 RepID=A0ABU5DY46_9PROT|nr:zinc-dependent alcohol dehydrogenase family protein [Dongia rigui]MDY0872228.1 zinc-dependent alcohol dehydrogenase family protein [Dongia rigui]
MTARTMRALIATGPDAPFQLTERPRPVVAAGEVLVRIKASGVNPLDLKIRAGEAAHARHPLPAILGLDMAGTVEAVGAGVTGFRYGDEVFGMVGGVGGHQGTLAQYVAADADLLALKPTNLSFREAAALPLIFITAWEGLVDRAHVQPGEKVLVLGGAGGVGHMVVQLAKAKGAEVYATDRDSPVEAYVAKFTDGEGFDVVYDTVGGASLDAAFRAVKSYTGRVVSCLGWSSHALAPLSFRAATYSGVFTLLPLLSGKGRPHHGDILRQAAVLAENGQLLPRVDPTRYTLAQADAAHDALRQRRAQGKVVIEID